MRRAAEEATSVVIGLGILSYNRVQARRRAWERSTGHRLPSMTDMADAVTSTIGMMTSRLADRGPR